MRHALLPLALIAVASCGHGSRETPREGSGPAASQTALAPAKVSPGGPSRPVVLEAADPGAVCAFGYKGPVVDLGNPRRVAELGTKLDPLPVDFTEHEGSSWMRVHAKTLAVHFFVVPPADVTAEGPAGAAPFVEARVRGGSAKTIAFFLNGRALGSTPLPHGDTRVVAVKSAAAQPVSGLNELSVRVTGLAKGVTDPAVEIEWVHFGVGDPDPEYDAPTARETYVSKSFGGEASRALSLRGPGFARCAGWIPAGSVVETHVRLEGKGAADAEIRLVRDRVPPTVIGTLHLDASDTGDARVRSWPVGDLGALGTLAAVELSVVRASPGARVIFGAPRVLGPPAPSQPEPAKTPNARAVVLIVMSQLGPHLLAPYGGAAVTPAITALAASGEVLSPGRATTGVANGAVASMLTGLSARDLAMSDADARLPLTVTTVADAVRQAGIAAAFFTANPLTSSPFGFERGWSHFESHGPVEDGPATRVFDAATTWMNEHHDAPFLLVIHARGGHPPWDVSLEQVKNLPPPSYTGGLEARRAGELLGHAFRVPSSYRFDDADRARAWALYGAAMEAEDAGVGRVVAALAANGLADDATVILTSDEGVNEAARVPFVDTESLDEAALATPLIVRWAHGSGHGEHHDVVSSGADVARTILGAFGLPAPSAFGGEDLRVLSRLPPFAPPRALLAVDREHFALRWGTLVTTGTRAREGKLCDLGVEPACVTDVRESYPLASRLLHSAVYEALVAPSPPIAREPASLDAPAQAALKAWGR